MFDDVVKPKPSGHQVGMPLETLSVAELSERIAQLEGEIERLRAAIEARNSTRQEADAAFKF